MKNIRIILLLAVFVSMFYGCIDYEQSTWIKRDGSGEMTITLKKHFPDSLHIKKYVFSDTAMFNKDSLTNLFTSTYNKIEFITVSADSTDSTYKAVVKISFNSIDSLNNLKVFKNFKFSYVDGAPKQKIFTQEIPVIPFEGFNIVDSTAKIKFVYQFSGEIVVDNATGKDIKTNKLYWEYKQSELTAKKTISVTLRPYKLDETPIWIYVLAGGMLLIVFIFLIKKKKA